MRLCAREYKSHIDFAEPVFIVPIFLSDGRLCAQNLIAIGAASAETKMMRSRKKRGATRPPKVAENC
jgi:hypothetical protein